MSLTALPLSGCQAQSAAVSEVAPSESASEPAPRPIEDAIVARLDLTSFPNSTGPRREPGKHTFSDYGFSVIEPTEKGARLRQQDGGWMMGFEVLAVSASSVQICFVDAAVKRPSDFLGPSYNARAALLVSRDETSASSLWSARQVPEGFPGCSNEPRVES